MVNEDKASWRAPDARCTQGTQRQTAIRSLSVGRIHHLQGNADGSQGLNIHWGARPPPSASEREREIAHVQRKGFPPLRKMRLETSQHKETHNCVFSNHRSQGRKGPLGGARRQTRHNGRHPKDNKKMAVMGGRVACLQS